jgi:hypothetical protein
LPILNRPNPVVMMIAIAVLAAASACSKKQPPPPPPQPVESTQERVAPTPAGTSQTVLEKSFSVKTSSTFPFEVPAHISRPHLHGIFQAFAGKLHGASDDTANIDFVILNEEQQNNAANGRPSEALFSVEGSHNQAINFDFPPSMNQPVTYYLVFRNPDGNKGSKFVEANFRVDF